MWQNSKSYYGGNFMKKVFIIEENDVEELLKNANITMAILHTVLNKNNIDQATRKQLSDAFSCSSKVYEILGK